MNPGGSGIFDDRMSPLSATEPLSGSTSPQVSRPAFFGTRPRSSSINSNGSNQSNRTRSLSIASLESPRNSIVSIDDGFLRTTRNNSTNSINSGPDIGTPRVSHSGNTFSSLGNGSSNNSSNASTPINLKDRLLFTSKHKPPKSSAILSDDDSEAERIVTPKPKIRSRRSSSNSKKREKLDPWKKDYRFKFNENMKDTMKTPNYSNNRSTSGTFNDDSDANVPSTPSSSIHMTPINSGSNSNNNALKLHMVNKSTSSLHNKSPGSSTNIMDPTPSPLSLNVHESLSHSTIEKNREDHVNKKSSIKPNNYPHHLKKNLLFSKDILLELSAMRELETAYNTKFMTKDNSNNKINHKRKLKIPSKSNDLNINNDTSINNELMDEPNDQSRSDNEEESKGLPILSTLQQQNKLITQLNQKWNKPIRPSASNEGNTKTKRRYLTSDEESDI